MTKVMAGSKIWLDGMTGMVGEFVEFTGGVCAKVYMEDNSVRFVSKDRLVAYED